LPLATKIPSMTRRVFWFPSSGRVRGRLASMRDEPFRACAIAWSKEACVCTIAVKIWGFYTALTYVPAIEVISETLAKEPWPY